MIRLLICLSVWVFLLSYSPDSKSIEHNFEPLINQMLLNGIPLEIGSNHQSGQFVLAIGLSELSDQNAREDAKLKALSEIGEFLQGTQVSRQTVITETQVLNHDQTEYSHQFYDEIRSQFQGHIEAARIIKQGQHDNLHYVVVLLSTNGHTEQQQIIDKTNLSVDNTLVLNSTTDSTPRPILLNVIGYASTSRKSKKEARQLALEDAFINAINQVNGLSIESQTNKFNRSIEIATSTRSRGYIESYKIVDEKVEGRDYKIELSATVNRHKLKQDNQAFLSQFLHARFAINSNNPIIKAWFTDQLLPLGFRLLTDQNQASHVFKVELNQTEIVDQYQQSGYQTSIQLALIDVASTEILFTLSTNPNKSSVYTKPPERALALSLQAAFRSIEKRLEKEIIEALVKRLDN